MPSMPLTHATPGAFRAPLRNPSRLREVQTADGTASHAIDDVQMHSTTVQIGEYTAYELGEEISQFASTFLHGQAGDVFGETGLLAQYYLLCQQQIESQSQYDPQDSRIQMWESEARTWDLVQRLYLQRTGQVVSTLKEHQFNSNRAREQIYYDRYPAAAELHLALDWLKDGKVTESTLKIRGNHWFHTREAIVARKRMAKAVKNIVSELDPDAPTRLNRHLHDDDAEYERSLLITLFDLIRAGEFSQAADLARQSGNHWRAASIQGYLEWNDPAVDDIDSDNVAFEGAPNKSLWRRMCQALSQQASLDTYERALYGALCGDLASVLPVCKTWEDRLWAQLNTIDQADLAAFLSQEQTYSLKAHSQSQIGVVLDSLLHSEDEAVQQQARAPLIVIQARLLTNQLDRLLADVHQQLKAVQAGQRPTAAASPQVLRFLTHLVLVLRQLNIEYEEIPANAILQAYIDLLISAREHDAVIIYAAQLPQADSIESVAQFWSNIVDDVEREQQVQLARDFDLSSDAIILRTIDIVFEEVLVHLDTSSTIVNIGTDLSQTEERAIRAIEWLLLGDNLQQQKLQLGNVLYRRLLLAGRLNAAAAFNLRMPDSSMSLDDLVSEDDAIETEEEERMHNAIEFVAYSTLVRALSAYESWKELVRARPQEINGRRDPIGLRQWKGDVTALAAQCTSLLQEVLDTAWCDPKDLEIQDEDHAQELLTLQKLYIPKVVLSLHGVYSSHECRNIQAAMDLAVQVAEKSVHIMQDAGMLKVYVAELSRIGSFLV